MRILNYKSDGAEGLPVPKCANQKSLIVVFGVAPNDAHVKDFSNLVKNLRYNIHDDIASCVQQSFNLFVF